MVVDLAKEMVARGSEILAVGHTAGELLRSGVPVTEVPVFTATSSAPHEAFQLLHPRIHGGLLGDWSDREQREELERQGVKRIDMVVVELPDLLQAGESGPGLQDRFEVGGAAVLRSAARNPEWVTAICDLSDFPAVTRDMDSRSGRVGDEIRKRLAIKALQAVARHDAVLAAMSLPPGDVPDSWSVYVDRLQSLPVVSDSDGRAGLFEQAGNGRSQPGLVLLSGKPLTPGVLLDADLAWSVVEDHSEPAAAISHNEGLCGFSLVRDEREEGLEQAFARARAVDPRGSFGGVAGFNREVGRACARALGASFLEAVLAPDFSASARAELGRSKIRLLQVSGTERPSVGFVSTRWGLLLRWSRHRSCAHTMRAVSSRQPDDAERDGLRLAWSLVRRLRPMAVVIADRSQMLAAGAAQTSWRDAARMAAIKMPAGVMSAVAACGNPIRFAEDVALLAEAGITAILHPAGSPRQAEVVERVDQLGLALQVVENEVGE